MKENHARFLRHLEKSKAGVWTAAQWLNEIGYEVSVPVTTKAENHAQWREHADGGDLFIRQRVEVKQLSARFTCASDWPFSPKFIVCAKHAFDSANPKPMGYIILNCEGTHAAIVRSTSCGQWYTEIRRDSRYDSVAQEFYFAPMEHVKFFSVG